MNAQPYTNGSLRIETPRLIIRELLAEDEDAMFDMDSDPEVHRYLGNRPYADIAETRRYIACVLQQYAEMGIGRWVVILKASGKVIGWTGFKRMTAMVNGHVGHLDFGYRFQRAHWGNGYGFEAAQAVLVYGIDVLNFKDIYGMTDIANEGSRRILEKLGFQFVEIFAYDDANTWHAHHGKPTTWYKLNAADNTFAAGI